MQMKEQILAKRYMFMPGHTVNAVIKQHNFYDVTSEELELLQKQFNELNMNKLFKPGMSALVPVLPRHHEKAFSPEETQ